MDEGKKRRAILIPESKEGAIPIEQNLCFQCFQPRGQEQGPCPHCGYDPAKDEGRWPSALHPGSILNGKYILGRVLGQGGFGITYLAFDHVLRIRVAVKEYFPGALASRMPGTTLVNPLSPGSQEEFRYGAERFLEEARILASLAGNPGVVNVSSFFEENATAYFVMEYLEGVSLQAYLREKGGRIPWQEALRILIPVMQSLAPVHRQGLLHRDIAPDNIFLAKNGVKLIDFGAARYSLGDRSRSRVHALADKRRAKTLVRKQHVGVGVARLDGRHLALFVKQNFHVRVDIHQQIARLALLGHGLEQRRHHDRKHDRDHKHGGDRRDRDREPHLAPRRASTLCAALGRRADGRIRDPLTHLGRNAFELVFETSFEIFVVHRSSSFIYLRNFLSALLYFHVTVPSGLSTRLAISRCL